MIESTGEGQAIDEQEALKRLEQRDDASDRYYAAWWLGHERSRHPCTLPLLKAALGELFETNSPPSDDCRALSLNVLRALAHLDGTEAETEIVACLTHSDQQIREEAARTAASARLDKAIAPLCKDLSNTSSHSNRLLEAQIEALGALAKPSEAVIQLLTPFTDSEKPLICSAANRALLQVTGHSRWSNAFQALVQHPSAQVRRGVLLDIGAVGWIPALEMIQTSAVENSIKLIALRGLAEHPRGLVEANMSEQEACDLVLSAMDALL